MKRRAGLYCGGLSALSSQRAVSESTGTPQVADKADGPPLETLTVNRGFFRCSLFRILLTVVDAGHRISA
jgi:hypothetical protein